MVYGAYDEFVREAWKHRDHPNMHIVFYEDLKADTVNELRRLSDFIGTKLTDGQLKKVIPIIGRSSSTTLCEDTFINLTFVPQQ